MLNTPQSLNSLVLLTRIQHLLIQSTLAHQVEGIVVVWVFGSIHLYKVPSYYLLQVYAVPA